MGLPSTFLTFLFAIAAFVSAPAHATASPRTPVEVARLSCTAHVLTGAMSCLPLDADRVGPGDVGLAVQNARHASGTWSADVAIQNRSQYLLGAAAGDGSETGVQAHLLSAPVTTAGLGSVRTDTDVFQYGGALLPGAMSSARTWRFQVDPLVDAFTFQVSLVAVVTSPGGWIALSSSSASLLLGETHAVTAAARAANGAAMPGSFLTWTTADADVATVSPAGLITGVAPGATTVTARRGGSSGSVSVDVCPDLAVGGVYHATLTNGGRLCLGGYAGAEYTVMPTNQSTFSSLTLTVTGTGIVGVTGPPTPLTDPPADTRVAELGLDGSASYREPAAGERAADRAAIEAAELARLERDRDETTPLLQRADTRIDGPATGATNSIIPPGVPAVNDVWTLNVAQGCSGAVDNRTATVRSISTRAIIVSDNANPPGGFTTVQYDSLAARFDRIVWRSIAPAFGAPADLDANGRVVLFYTRAVNELSPPASSVVNYGYFTNRDLFSSAPGSCERSNEGEILYMLVPDPTGAVNSNVRTVSFVEGNTTRHAGRELLHLINASRRIYVNGASTFEEPWLSLGLAGIAEELMFYNQSVGLAPRQNIVASMLTSGPNAARRVAAFNTYANQNYGRLRTFLQRPDIRYPFSDVTSTSTTDVEGNQGATWAFLRYAADRRNGDDNVFWSSLIGTPETGSREGLDNIRFALGLATQDDVLTWFRDWNVAMYADDAVAGLPTTYQTTSWSYRSLYTALHGSYQLVPRPLTDAVPLTLSYARGGSTAFLRLGVPSSGVATITTGSPGSSQYPVSVVRTK